MSGTSLTDFFQPFIDWADGFGLVGLAIVSATEAAFQPIPPDVLVIPMVVEADSLFSISMIVLVATLSSVLGAFVFANQSWTHQPGPQTHWQKETVLHL